MTTRIAHARVSAWARECLLRCGVPADDAQTVAESLVQTSLWGIDSHGILRLTHYLNRLRIGSIRAAATPVVKYSGPCSAQIDGCDGLGIVHCTRGVEVATGLAREAGIGVVGISNSSHCGAMALYTRPIAARRLVGIAMTHSSAVVIPHGGNARFFGTNPISIAIPRQGTEPVCLDMATSQVAWNKILNARIENESIEPGLAVDASGKPTTDAQRADALVPLGGATYGYKGYGLAFMIDLLCGALNGMSFGPHINKMYEDLDTPRKLGHFIMAIDPRRFAGADTIEATVAALVKDLKSQSAAQDGEPAGEILFPGEPELRHETERRVSGIPIAPAALADMDDWSGRLGVEALSKRGYAQTAAGARA